MRSKLYLVIICLFTCFYTLAYTSPGANQKLTLTDLVTLSGGEVTFTADAYNINANIIISLTDTLSITQDAIVKFAAGFSITINGVMIVNPANEVKFTAQNTGTGYNGIALVASNASYFKKMTFEYGVSFKMSDSK